MKPGSRLGKDPLNRPEASGSGAVLKNILEPSAGPDTAENARQIDCADANRRYAQATDHLLSLAAAAGMIGASAPHDRAMLLLMRMIGALRLTPQDVLMDMQSYLQGVSGPWIFDCPAPDALLDIQAGFALAQAVETLVDCLRCNEHPQPLTLRLRREAEASTLRLFGCAHDFPEGMGSFAANPARALKNLALCGQVSAVTVTGAAKFEVRIGVSHTL